MAVGLPGALPHSLLVVGWQAARRAPFHVTPPVAIDSAGGSMPWWACFPRKLVPWWA